MAKRAGIYAYLTANTAGFAKGLKRGRRQAHGFARDLKRTMAGVGIALGGAALVRSMVQAVSEQQRVLAQLRVGLKSTGAVSGQTMQSLQALSAEMQRNTVFSNEMVEQAEAVMLSFTEIADDVFPRAIKATADIAARMQIDLKSAVLQVAKALNAPIQNLGALSRAGIQFSTAQKTVIKDLWETGRQAEAQRVILKELERQYGGSAKAARDTLGGALTALRNDYDDLVKTIGAAVVPPVKKAVGAIGKAYDLWQRSRKELHFFLMTSLEKEVEENSRTLLSYQVVHDRRKQLKKEEVVAFVTGGLDILQAEIAVAVERAKNEHADRITHAARMQRLKKETAATLSNIGAMTTGFRALTAVDEQESKKAFRAHKNMAIADVIVNTAAAAIGVWAKPGWPAALPLSIGILASGAAQLRTIKKTSFGGGGGGAAAPAMASAGPTPAVGGVGGGGGGPARMVNVTLTGEMFGAQQIRDLIESINEEVEDGTTLMVA